MRTKLAFRKRVGTSTAVMVAVLLLTPTACSTSGTATPAETSLSTGAGATTSAPSTSGPTGGTGVPGSPTAPNPGRTGTTETGSTETPTTPTTTPDTTGGPATGPDVPTDLAGEVYGYLTSVDPDRSRITVDKVDYFSGEAAARACAEDGVTRTDNNWCTERYWRNNNPLLREVQVSPDATIVILVAGSPNEAVTDLAGLATRLDTTRFDTHSGNIFRMNVDGGQVTRLEEMYSP